MRLVIGGGEVSWPERGRGFRLLLLVSICTGVGLLFASHLRLYHRVEWPLALWWGLKDWYLWGALAPLVVWLTRSLPPSRSRWLGALGGHLVAAVLLAVVHPTLSISISALFEGLGGGSWLEAVQGLFLKKYVSNLVTYSVIAGTVHGVDVYRRFEGQEAPRMAEEVRGRSTTAATARRTERLLVRRGEEARFVDVARIDHIEAVGNYARIHVGEEVYFERRTLKSLERQLDAGRILRIHRSHLVNVDRIDRIEPGLKASYEVVLHDGTRLALSRSCRRRLQERVGESL